MKPYIYQGKDDNEQVPEDTTHLIIHQDVTEIPPGLCYGCAQLLSVIMGDKVIMIHHNAFRNCRSIRFVRLSCRLLYIGMWAFCGCAEIETLAIPSTVRVIEYEAFMLCTSLRLLQFPKRIEFIGEGVVRYCENLLPTAIASHEEYKAMSAQEKDEEILNWLKYRFEEYPLHELCLDASISSRKINKYIDEHGTSEAFVGGENDMTPLHVLAKNPNAQADSILSCFYMNPTATFHRDEEGLNAIDHAIKSNTESMVTLITALCINGE